MKKTYGNTNRILALGLNLAVVLGLCAPALATINWTLTLQAKDCNFSGTRVGVQVVYPNQGVVTMANTVVAGTTGPVGTAGLGFVVTNAGVQVNAIVDGQIVYTRTFSQAQWNANSQITNYIGAYYGDTCRDHETNQTYTSCFKNYNPSPQHAYWAINNNIVHEEIASAGETVCYTFTFNPQTDSLQWGFLESEVIFTPQSNGDGSVTLNPQTQFNLQSPQGGGNGTSFDHGGTNTQVTTTNNVNYNGPTGLPWTNYGYGGPIDFSGTGTGAARDDTLKAGFNAVIVSQQGIKDAIDLNTLALLNGSGSNWIGGGSNEISLSITNIGDTNGLTLEQYQSWNATNQAMLDNKVTTLAEDTATAYNADPNYTALKDAYDNPASEAGLPSAYSVPSDVGPSAGGDIPLDFGLMAGVPHLNSTAVGTSGFYYGILKWCILYALFMKIQRSFYRSMNDALFIPQASTAGQTVLGTNANAASALVMASIIVGAIFAAGAFFLASMIGTGAAMVSVNPVSIWDSLGSGASFVGAILPFKFLVAAWIALAVYEATKGGVMVIAGGAVKFCVGL